MTSSQSGVICNCSLINFGNIRFISFILPVWYENLSGVVIRPEKSRHKHRQQHFHRQKIYLLRIFSIDPASISVKKVLFSPKQHRSTLRNNSLHPGYLTSLVTRTNHNTIQTIDVYVQIYPDGLPCRTDFHTTPAEKAAKNVTMVVN